MILAKHYKSITSLARATLENLIEVDEIGEKIAESVVDFFEFEKNIEIIDRLKAVGVQLEIPPDELEAQSNKLEGKRIVVSGVFETISRNELKKRIEDNGGKVVSSISARTSYIVAGANMGPSKRIKAEQLNITIISEQDFLQLII